MDKLRLNISQLLKLFANYLNEILCKKKMYVILWKTSLLRRLQEQTLPNATQPIGTIHPFSKMTGTQTLKMLWFLWDLGGRLLLFLPIVAYLE